jgi:DNA-binding GntR family transcriptional regulator
LCRALAERAARRSGIEEHVDADTAFHRGLPSRHRRRRAQPDPHPVVRPFVPRSRQAMIEMLRIRGAFGDDADRDTHARVLDAIAAKDGRAAAELSRAHLLAMKERLS